MSGILNHGPRTVISILTLSGDVSLWNPITSAEVLQIKQSSQSPSRTSPRSIDVYSVMKSLEVGVPTSSKIPQSEEGGESLVLSRNRKLCQLWLHALAWWAQTMGCLFVENLLLLEQILFCIVFLFQGFVREYTSYMTSKERGKNSGKLMGTLRDTEHSGNSFGCCSKVITEQKFYLLNMYHEMSLIMAIN